MSLIVSKKKEKGNSSKNISVPKGFLLFPFAAATTRRSSNAAAVFFFAARKLVDPRSKGQGNAAMKLKTKMKFFSLTDEKSIRNLSISKTNNS